MNFVQWIEHICELQLILSILLEGFYWSLEIESIVPIILNLVMTIVKFLLNMHPLDLGPKVHVIEKIRLITLIIQLGLICRLSQFGLIVVILLTKQRTMFSMFDIKLFILGTIIVYNIVEQNDNNFVIQFPFNLLLISIIILQIVLIVRWWRQSNKINKQQTQSNPLFQIQIDKQSNDEQNSQKLPEIINGNNIDVVDELIKLNSKVSQSRNSQSNDINLSSNKKIHDDDLVIQHMSWIQNQQVLVYNSQLNIIYQNLYLGKLLKSKDNTNRSPDKDSVLDLEQIFLNSLIVIGSRELNEISSINGFNDSIYSDGSFLLNTISDYHKCRVKANYTVIEMANQMLDNFDRWRSFTLNLFKLKNQYLDFSGLQIKVFVQLIGTQKFIFFFFEPNSIITKQSIDINHSVVNIISTFLQESLCYLNAILTLVLLTIHEVEIGIKKKETNQYVQRYGTTMRMVSYRHNLFLNNMRDYIFYIQNQLFIKTAPFRITDLVEEILIIYDDNLRVRDTGLTTSIDLNDSNAILFSDLDRIKSILSCILSYCLKYTSSGQLKLDIKSFTMSGIIISIKDSHIGKDEQAKKQVSQLIKTLNNQLKQTKFIAELDLNNPLELQIIVILSYLVSGSFKRGLDFLYDSAGNATFTFVIESQSNQARANPTQQDSGPIRILGDRRYYETSLSMILAQDSSNYKDESKYISFTQLSKQFSMKHNEPIDLQSAYFSQISRIKQDTSNSRPLNSNSNPKQSKEQSQSNSDTQKQKFNQESIIQQKNLASKNKFSSNCKSESAHDSAKTHSILDFGNDSSTPSIHPPEFLPKLLASVIKYRLRLDCCAKVLIVDADPYSVMVLELVLNKYNIKCDRVFNGLDGKHYIEKKTKQPCHCGNSSYLLYFIEINLPILSGMDLVRLLKDKMKGGEIDKGYCIAMTTFVDISSKLNCFRYGTDYFITKPFDLVDISAAVQYLDF